MPCLSQHTILNDVDEDEDATMVMVYKNEPLVQAKKEKQNGAMWDERSRKKKQKFKEIQVLKWNFVGVLNTISLRNGIKYSFTYTPPFHTSTDIQFISNASFTFHFGQTADTITAAAVAVVIAAIEILISSSKSRE